MRNFLLRVIVSAIAIAVTAALLPGIRVANNDIFSFLLLGLIFGVVNALIKPIVTIMSCPLVILTLGLFLFVINGIMLLITAALSGGRLFVDGLGWAIIGGIIMGLVNMVLEVLLGMNDQDRPRQIAR
ncbi:MAG: phage holin family protein [Chloroflexi bacterium]|nr:phage holin family protein [Chloroflexota bacterium]MCL5274112.1 phage holin family protein [Chloroflexota bacterium]